MSTECEDCGWEMEPRDPLPNVCEACRRLYQDEAEKFRGYRADRTYYAGGMNGENTESD